MRSPGPLFVRSRGRMAVVALLAVLLACGDDEAGPLGTGEERIGPAGGRLQSSDGDAEAIVPPGALEEETVLTVEQLEEDEIPDALAERGPVSDVYRFAPDGLQFERPVRVQLFFDDETLPAGVDVEDLTIVKLDESGQVVELSDITIFTPGLRGISLHGRRGIGGLISSFSPFAVVVDDTPGSPPIVTEIVFPGEISNAPADSAFGRIDFVDADGDLARALVQEVFDPNDAIVPFVVQPDDTLTVTEGSLGFFVTCDADVPCRTGPVTMRVVLEDHAGNESEPVEFSFDIVD